MDGSLGDNQESRLTSAVSADASQSGRPRWRASSPLLLMIGAAAVTTVIALLGVMASYGSLAQDALWPVHLTLGAVTGVALGFLVWRTGFPWAEDEASSTRVQERLQAIKGQREEDQQMVTRDVRDDPAATSVLPMRALERLREQSRLARRD